MKQPNVIPRAASSAVLGLVMSLSSLFVLASDEEVSDAIVTYRITIEPDGSLSKFDSVAGEPTPFVRQTLESNIRGWKFRPGSKDGHLLQTITFMTVTIDSKETASGESELVVDHVNLGPLHTEWQPPRYPAGARYRMVNARVSLIVEVAPDGIADRINVDYVQTDNKRHAQSFLDATLLSVQGTRFVPEQIGAQPIASSIPIRWTFCLKDRGCDRLWKRLPKLKESKPMERGAELPALVSDVVGKPLVVER